MCMPEGECMWVLAWLRHSSASRHPSVRLCKERVYQGLNTSSRPLHVLKHMTKPVPMALLKLTRIKSPEFMMRPSPL